MNQLCGLGGKVRSTMESKDWGHQGDNVLLQISFFLCQLYRQKYFNGFFLRTLPLSSSNYSTQCIIKFFLPPWQMSRRSWMETERLFLVLVKTFYFISVSIWFTPFTSMNTVAFLYVSGCLNICDSEYSQTLQGRKQSTVRSHSCRFLQAQCT